MVSPVVERLARDHAGKLLAVKIPAIMMFWKGRAVMRLQGAQPYAALRQAIERSWPR